MGNKGRYFTKAEFGIIMLCIGVPLAFIMALFSLVLFIGVSLIISIILLYYMFTEDKQAGKKISENWNNKKK